jgi:hydroxypyruvate reductase
MVEMAYQQTLQAAFGKWLHGSQAQMAAEVVDAALAAVDPEAAVLRSVERCGAQLVIEGQTLALDAFRRVKVAAIGKAALAMTRGLLQRVGDKITAGVVVCKHMDADAYSLLPGQIQLAQGNHPVPGEDSIAGGKLLAELLADGEEDDLVVCLISGGGSALVTWPQEGVSLADLQALTRELLACGAAIEEINCLRKHLDRVKGGGLARLAAPARLVTLVLSDVVGSPLDVIASGPTVADPTSFTEALGILEKYGLLDQTPASILSTLQAGAAGRLAETPKPGDALLQRTQTFLVADNYRGAQAAVKRARELGFHSQLVTIFLQGEAREAGGMLAGILRQVAMSGEPLARPACLIFGGETTVTIRGQGKGGRNQELALGAVTGLDGLEDVLLAALGTDGEDGPTDAAGAFACGQMRAAAVERGLAVDAYLGENDAYHFFAEMHGLLMTGPTGTNVNDLTFLFAF